MKKIYVLLSLLVFNTTLVAQIVNDTYSFDPVRYNQDHKIIYESDYSIIYSFVVKMVKSNTI